MSITNPLAPPARSPLATLLAYCLWPALVISSGSILAFGFVSGHPAGLSETLRKAWFFNLSYLWLLLWLFLLERRRPWREAWQQSDRQLAADLSHTLLDKGSVQFTIILLSALPFFAHRGAGAVGSLPLWVQVVIGLVASEFGLYWAHRLSHEWPVLWRFHAVHHSVRRLWIVNTGRFHFIDSNLSVLASLPFLLLTGISMDAIIWMSAITAYLGLLTHCNVAMRGGWLDYLFNTPNLHRWHHSTNPSEGNSNYGQNLVLWDQLFGTWLRRPDAELGEIGIVERMPLRFREQLWVPFIWRRYQRESAGADPATVV